MLIPYLSTALDIPTIPLDKLSHTSLNSMFFTDARSAPISASAVDIFIA